jgi:hypothetical protein
MVGSRRALQGPLGRHVIFKADNFKFSSPAKLGHDIVIETTVREPKASEAGVPGYAPSRHPLPAPRPHRRHLHRPVVVWAWQAAHVLAAVAGRGGLGGQGVRQR